MPQEGVAEGLRQNHRHGAERTLELQKGGVQADAFLRLQLRDEGVEGDFGGGFDDQGLSRLNEGEDLVAVFARDVGQRKI